MTESEHYVTVHVSTELLAKLREWSQPVQAQIQETPGYGTGYEMIFRVSEPTLTASEVKVLTETASKVAYALGRKDAGEDIARTADEIAEGCSAAAKQHRQASIDATTDRKKRSHMQTAQAFANQAAGAWAVWEFARDYPYEALQDASDATSGVPGHPEVSEAVRSPQEPCEAPDCPIPLMHTHPWLNAPGPHHPVGIRSTDVGPFVQCSCGDNPTPKYWIEHHWPGDRTEGERLVRSLIRDTKEDPS